MESPSYRIATICPFGMPEDFRRYLNQPTKDGLTTRDVIALRLVESFVDSTLPFCATVVGWNREQQGDDKFPEYLLGLSNLTCAESEELVSVDGFHFSHQMGQVFLAGIYPLADSKNVLIGEQSKKLMFLLGHSTHLIFHFL